MEKVFEIGFALFSPLASGRKRVRSSGCTNFKAEITVRQPMTLHSRTKRVSEEIRSALADLILTELKDPRLTDVMITVNAVHTSKDLHNAQVYVSVLADDAKSAEVIAALNQASGFLKHGVAERVALRFTPNLAFRLDETGRNAARINALLKKIEREQPVRDEKTPDPTESGEAAEPDEL
jgi:ribosome-binding factor A